MLSFRTSRPTLLVACAAFAVLGCLPMSGLPAHAQPGDLDALAYGDLSAAPPARSDRGFFGGRSVRNSAAQPPRSMSGADVAPRVIKAETPPHASGSIGGGGLLEALGMRFEADPQSPMDSNAQLAPAPLPAPAPALAPLPSPVAAPMLAQLPPVAPVVYAAPAPAPAIEAVDPGYKVDAGDKLRVVVFGQEGLTNSYAVDAGGGITMPLIGRVVARGMTPAGLAAHITARLRKGYIREPSVAVEVEAYRPFFILGEVAAPGQYPYVPNMSVEAAVAIAGGFTPRARRDSVMLTQKVDGGRERMAVPLGTPLNPGDTVMVGERWF